MNTAIVEKAAWSRPHWCLVVGGLLLLQVTGLFVVSKRTQPAANRAPRWAVVRFLGESPSDPRVTEALALQDPLVFTRILPRDFFDTNWLATSRSRARAAQWTEPDRFLGPSDQYFADEFRTYVAATVRPSTLPAEKTPAALTQVAMSSATLPNRALFRVEGDLAGRKLISNHPAPANESSALLTNTVLRVAVDHRGDTILATVFTTSGLPRTDQSALDFASRARFEPMKSSDPRSQDLARSALTFGHFIFQWFPVVAVETNRITAKP